MNVCHIIGTVWVFPEDPTCSTTTTEYTVSLGSALKVTTRHEQLCALAHVRACIWSVTACCEGKVKRWLMRYESYLFSFFHIQWEHLCLLSVQVVLSSCIQVTLSLTFLPSPPLITSDGQFPLKRGQIYCATECAEGFLGRWARTAEMERRKEDNQDKLGSFISLGTTKFLSLKTMNLKLVKWYLKKAK